MYYQTGQTVHIHNGIHAGNDGIIEGTVTVNTYTGWETRYNVRIPGKGTVIVSSADIAWPYRITTTTHV